MTDTDLKYATKLVISLVKSPFYKEAQANLDRELKHFFNTKRRFAMGDHFSIKSVQNNDLVYQFKVIESEPRLNEFFVDNSRTSLVQTESGVKDKWIWPDQEKFEIVSKYVNEIERVMNFYRIHHVTSETLPLMLLHGPSGSGKLRTIEGLAAKLSMHLCKINAVNLVGDSASAVEKRIEYFLNQSMNYGPCIIFIKSFQFLFKLKDINEFNKRIINSFFQSTNNLKTSQKTTNQDGSFTHDSSSSSSSQFNFFIICSTTSKQSLDSSILANFNFELELKCLNEAQRRLFMKKPNLTVSDSETKDFLKKTSGLYYGELATLMDYFQPASSDNCFSNQFQIALKSFLKHRKFQQENKLNIDTINWSDIGGLSGIKQIITDTILFPLNYPKLFASNEKQLGITRSGILLYGPPGTGKTLLAKAISNECELNFLSVKGPELLDMYVGQTEQNVRNLFEKARLNAPCVLFFDELDSLAPIRGRAGDSGGVMDRVVSQLLTEIDGLDKFSSATSADTNKSSQIFLIAATNRPDLIDGSLLRPGRFDKLIYVPIAKSSNERLKILEALLRKLPIEKEFDLTAFIDKCPTNLSGADFYALTNKARQHALKRVIADYESNKTTENTAANNDVCLKQEDFNYALVGFQPTLSETAFAEYEKYFKDYSNKR